MVLRISLFASAISFFCMQSFANAAYAAECRIEKKATLTLGFTNGLATIPVKINGKIVIMGVDTGADTLLTPQAAAALRLKRDAQGTEAIGTTGTIRTQNVLVQDLEFAGNHHRNLSVAKIGLPGEDGSSH